ncbi:sugar-binding domain-containing protein [Micromonospora sp. NPDC005299]|uniref:sugar-binding domain-containing protein n=1 Tax=Micromonospora sp. NPDC005299 TaxID=3364231 RepID=UPI00369F4EC8
MTDQTALHPRPQLVRDRWTDLCGEWEFAFDDDDRGLADSWYDAGAAAFAQTIVVPYPPESKLSGIGDTGFHPVVWYRRTFDAAPPAAGERLLLHFGAVDYRTTVWVNGALVGSHTGGQTPFTFDLTGVLTNARPQTVVVRAEDQPTDVSQPRGKQDWRAEPHGIFYDRTTGIWQPVWLEPVPDTHVSELHWTPDLPACRVGVELRLNRPVRRPVTVEVGLRHGAEELARHWVTVTDEVAVFDVAVPAMRHQMSRDALLWSPESPTILDAEVTVSDCDGRAVDRVTSYLGLRSAGFRDGRFLLNGRPYYLRLVLEQGYWPESHLAAPDADALRAEVELIKALGFNGARIHQKVEDPRFLYWCDRLGLLVWGEMANAYEFSHRAMERLVPEWLDVVRRDRSHPCIVTWVPLNESWGVADIVTEPDRQHYASALYHLTKALDPSRPAISNDGWELVETDIFGVHDYSPLGDDLRERWGGPDAVRRMLHGPGPGRRKVLLRGPGDPAHDGGQPVVITEFGGLSYAPKAGQKWFGYGTVTSPDELLAAFTDIVSALLDSTEVAGFCYTQLTDTLQERNGLVDEYRKPKLPLERIREVLTRPSRAIPAEAVDLSRRAARRAGAGE